jgi:hypothetical protein
MKPDCVSGDLPYLSAFFGGFDGSLMLKRT